MPAELSERTRYEVMIAEALGLPGVEVKGRVRYLHEGGFAPVWDAPLTDEHKIHIFLGLLASPSHAAVAATVRGYAAMTLRHADTGSHLESGQAVDAIFPRLAVLSLRDFLLRLVEVLRDEAPALGVEMTEAAFPPHERFSIRVRPRGLLPVTLTYQSELGLTRRLRAGAADRRIEQIQRCPGDVLEAIAHFSPRTKGE